MRPIRIIKCDQARTALGTVLLVVPILISGCATMPGAESAATSQSMDLGSMPARLELRGKWQAGPVFASAVSGDRVFFGTGGQLRVLQVNGPSTPSWEELVGTTISGVVKDLVTDDEHIFVADESGYLHVLEIAGSGPPRQVGMIEIPENARGIDVDGDHVFLAGSWSGLIIVSVEEPSAPRIVSATKTAEIATDVRVVDGHAYVTDRIKGFSIYDISDLSAPVQKARVQLPGQSYGIDVAGGYAYVVSIEQNEGDPAGLSVVNVLDVEAPQHIAQLELVYGAEKVWVQDQFVYLAGVANDAGLITVDISNPANPLRMGTYKDPTCSESVTVAGQFAYLSHGDEGLEIIDLSNPQRAPVVKHIDAAGKSRGVEVVDGLAYLANGYAGLRILDVSDPAAVKELSRMPTYRALGVSVRPPLVVVADDFAGVKFVDTSEISRPRIIGRLNTPGYAERLQMVDGIVYVADGEGGLQIIDATIPAEPKLLAGYDTPGYGYDLAVAGNTLYFADGDAGLRVFDITDPTSPVEIGLFGSAERDRFDARGVAVEGNLALIAAGYAGVSILDISNPVVPVEIGHVPAKRNARRVKIAGRTAYFGDLEWIRAIDLADPTAPREIASFKAPAYADDIWLTDDAAFVAAHQAGMLILGAEPEADEGSLQASDL
jgi:hypothetical protein